MAAIPDIAPDVADAAAGWLTVLMADEVTAAEREAWQRWRDADPEHERAWQHIEAVTGRFRMLHPEAAYHSLSPYPDTGEACSPRRRKVLGMLAFSGVAGLSLLIAARPSFLPYVMADFRTATGEQRTVKLADGSRILLNTASAINVHFDARRRTVQLLAGEVMIETGHGAGKVEPRPFVVATQAGEIRALGTRFAVRQNGSGISVTVLDSAVEIRPADHALLRRKVMAGESITFTRSGLGQTRAPDEASSAWIHGQIVAEDMPLARFVAELSRYRSGWVQCTPQVADLRVSGVFPLADTDHVLAALPRVLPVSVQWRSPFWVVVGVG